MREKMTNVMFKVDKALKNKVIQVAKRNNTTLSEVIRTKLYEYLKEQSPINIK